MLLRLCATYSSVTDFVAHHRGRSRRRVVVRGAQRPDYRRYLSLEILYLPYKWFAPQTPLKKIRKVRKKIPSKGHARHVPWLNLKKNFQISFSQYASNVGAPFFRSMRQAQNTDTHALNQLGCPKIVCHCDPISLLINTFGIHHEPGCKSHEQIINYRTAKKVQKQATVLLYFKTNSYKVTRKGFPVVWPKLNIWAITNILLLHHQWNLEGMLYLRSLGDQGFQKYSYR